MIKQQQGFNPETYDWEFFYIDVEQGRLGNFRAGFCGCKQPLGYELFAAHAARTRCATVADRSARTTLRRKVTASGPPSRAKRSVSSAAAASWPWAADRPAAIAVVTWP
jgi:hypothetical protein